MDTEAMDGWTAFGAQCDRALEATCANADALLLVPPFADLYHPSLGLHLLQACAREAGFRVGVLYTNLLFATRSGEEHYNAVVNSSSWAVGGERPVWAERLFAATAFGLPRLGRRAEQLPALAEAEARITECTVTLEDLYALEGQVAPFCAAIGSRIAQRRPPIVGATNSFDQTAASVALLSAVKAARPDTVCILGGSNCARELADSMAALTKTVDYVFSGECETVFPDFLRRVLRQGERPGGPVIHGAPCPDLDALPEPDFHEFFAQLANALPAWRERLIWLAYESSRGCWWWAAGQCSFCGYNRDAMAFREKSTERVVAGIGALLKTYPTNLVRMADNVLPHSYFKSVLPRLQSVVPPAHLRYLTRPDLTLDHVRRLKSAGVSSIIVGIESLSTPTLRRANKGVVARQCLNVLRYARALGVAVGWNWLCDFPGEEAWEYEAMAALVPLLGHLPPPTGLRPIVITRFSPYFREPDRYGITRIRPQAAYACVFPDEASVEALTCRFSADYVSAYRTEPGLRAAMERAVADWKRAWRTPDAPPPALEVTPMDGGVYLLTDTRGLPGTEMLRFLTEEQARAAIVGGPLGERPEMDRWAIEAKLAAELDGWAAPLAVCDYETWRRLEGAQTAETHSPLLLS